MTLKPIEKLMPLYHEMGEGVEEQLPSNEEIILKINELVEVVNEQSKEIENINKKLDALFLTNKIFPIEPPEVEYL